MPSCFTWRPSTANSGLWPSDLKSQADVLRWLTWESAHWDAESCGMVAYEKASKAVLGLGPPDPAFVARGEQNFARFAAVLDGSLKGRTWLIGERLTIADFSVGALVPSAKRMGLPVRTRFKAPAKVIPMQAGDPQEALQAFLESHAPVRRVLAFWDRVNFNRVRFRNPFVPVIRFTIGTGFEILSRHEARHLLQAERVKPGAS